MAIFSFLAVPLRTEARLRTLNYPPLGKDINLAQSIKHLGVTFDPTLSFDNHISTTVSYCMSNK